MLKLRDHPLVGNDQHVGHVTEYFGDIEFSTDYDTAIPVKKRVFFQVMRLDNIYRGMVARNTYGALFVLVPNIELRCVWARGLERYSCIKLGTATDEHGIICKAMCFQLHRESMGLYLCLSQEGKRIREPGALGI